MNEPTHEPEELLTPIRSIRMTDVERAWTRHRVMAVTQAQASVSAVGVWQWVRRHSALATGMAVVFLFGATGVSASKAGPDDFLYAFRTNVNDRVQTALAVGDDAKTDVLMQQLDRDLAEESATEHDLADAGAAADIAPTPADHAADTIVPGSDGSADDLDSIERDLKSEEDSLKGLE